MKAKILIAAGVALVAGAVYYFTNRKKPLQQSLPQKESERHHLTNVFSKAKEIAIGN